MNIFDFSAGCSIRGALFMTAMAALPTVNLSAQGNTDRQPHALVGGTLINGSTTPRPNTTIVFANGVITGVFDGADARVPNGARITNINGAFVIPGLIDTHVHVATNPSGSDSLQSVLTRLRAAVRGGVTTVRDMGGDARQLAYLARNATLGEITSPDIYYSGIVAGPEFMADPRVRASAQDFDAGAAPWARAVTADTEWVALAHQAKGVGVRGLKIYAAVSPSVMDQIVAAARSVELGVWAHATVFPARPSDAVRSGVQVLSHAPYLIWEAVIALPSYTERARGDFGTVAPDHPSVIAVLDRMAARDVMLDPTLFVFETRNAPAYEWGKTVTQIAWERGVNITTGTDAIGNDERPNLHREFELLVDAGLPNAVVLEAATINGARAIGIETSHGSVAVGKVADMLVLNANPLVDISNTREIRFVVRRGRIVGER